MDMTRPISEEGSKERTKQNGDVADASFSASAHANRVDLQGINFDDSFDDMSTDDDDDDHAWNSSLEDAIKSAEIWGRTMPGTQYCSQTTLVTTSEHDHEKYWLQATILSNVEIEDAHVLGFGEQGKLVEINETKDSDSSQVDIEDIGGKAARSPTRQYRGVRRRERQKIEHDSANQVDEKKENDVDSVPLPRKRFFSVTDVSSLSYCELQRYYALTSPYPPPRSAAMDNGTKIHRKLELQVHDIVAVRTSTREEGWGVRIYNMLAGLAGAAETGIAREVGVLGFVDGLGLVVGVIDGIERAGDWEWRISDTKTKTGFSRYTGRSIGMLSDGNNAAAAVNPGWVQVMLYKRLFDSLVDMAVAGSSAAIDAWIEKVCDALGVDPDASFSNEFVLQMEGLQTGTTMAEDIDKQSTHSTVASMTNTVISMQSSGNNPNLRGLFQMLFRTIGIFPYISPDLVIKYINQNTMEEWSEGITYDETFLREKLKRAVEFWKEGRKPEGVPEREAGKCRVCDFGETCTWRQQKIAERLKTVTNSNLGVR